MKTPYNFDKYLLTEENLYLIKEGKEGKKRVKLCPYIEVTKRRRNILTCEETITIVDGTGLSVTEPAKILRSNSIQDLISKGFIIPPNHANEISNALQYMKNDLKVTIETPYIGSINLEDKPKMIVLNKSYVSDEDANNTQEIISSSKLNISPKGSFKAWFDMFNNDVLGNAELELATVIGISGLVNAHLKNIGLSQSNSLFYHFYGDSSTGKTTSAMLALSTAGCPTSSFSEYDKESLFKTWAATSNALYNTLTNNYGVPLVFDEVSMSQIKDFTSTIYTITEGKEKLRLNKDATSKPVRNWNTSIISTGEYSILKNNKTAKNTGLNVRIIELSLQWTKTGEQSENIKNVITQNYGHILPMVAETLLNIEIEDFQKVMNEYKTFFENELVDDNSNTGKRMINTYVIIMLSLEILESVLYEEQSGNLSKEEVRKILVKYHWDSVSERKIQDKALDTVIQFVTKNRSYFTEGNALTNNRENYGLINFVEDKDDSYIRVDILKNVFEDMISADNFQDSKVVINALKDANYLIFSEEGRNTTRKQINQPNGTKKKIPFYSIKLGDDLVELLGLQSESNISTDQKAPKMNCTKNDIIEKFKKNSNFNIDDIKL
ncbi:DUF927 domain-containing protein [Macrococcus equi]|uniref:DUF927 domain-containing protein n=1 Tax=Macrococcus equi TaxID=3395462 RepID=UPI0039BDCF71